jgi:hypothetical protein
VEKPAQAIVDEVAFPPWAYMRCRRSPLGSLEHSRKDGYNHSNAKDRRV